MALACVSNTKALYCNKPLPQPSSSQQQHRRRPVSDTTTIVQSATSLPSSSQQHHCRCPVNNTTVVVQSTIPPPLSSQQHHHRPVNKKHITGMSTICAKHFCQTRLIEHICGEHFRPKQLHNQPKITLQALSFCGHTSATNKHTVILH